MFSEDLGIESASFGALPEKVSFATRVACGIRPYWEPPQLILSVFGEVATYLKSLTERFELQWARPLGFFLSACRRWLATTARGDRLIRVREARELEVTQMAAD